MLNAYEKFLSINYEIKNINKFSEVASSGLLESYDAFYENNNELNDYIIEIFKN